MYEFIYYRVRDVMSAPAVTVGPETPLAEVEDLFERHDFNALPVVDPAGGLLGVLSKLDFLKAFRFTPESIAPHYDEIMRQSAESVMSRDPLTVDPATPLTRVLEDMITTRFKSFPVVERGRVVGMVAREDVGRALRRAAAGERPDE
jgi:CBS domain-containing protein